ncbi:MAG: transglutaminase domain-containing protein, partial [Candidatus Bathyarchaeia archaeon]
RTRRTITQDWVLSYLQWRKGICVDAATALAVILRCQGIPSRISLGYKPTRVVGDTVLYYSNTSHAETEAYLPPYGWVRFDATPFSPLDLPEDIGALRPEKGLALEISPTEAEGYPGESIFYHLMVNNSRETKDHLELSIYNTNGWDCETTPESLLIRAYEARDALVEVKIPENASYGQVNPITVTATSVYDPDVKVSNTAIARVRLVKRAPTTTTITYFNDSVFRGDSFCAEGTVFTTNHEPVHDMLVLILFKENKEAKGTVCGNGLSQYGLFRIGGKVPFDTELGDYAVVAISLGTTEYAPSSSDPTITVAARTYTEMDVRLEDLSVTRPFLVEDHILISGFLRLDNGTAVSGATLELEILAPDPPTSRRHKIIAENGFFVKRFIFWTPGTYELNVTFPGRGYIASSYSYRMIEVGSPSVHLLTEDYCVRGEVLRISGNVSSTHGAIPGEPVTIAFDGETLEAVETGPNGTFFYNFEPSSEVQPGWHLLAYTLQKRNGIGTTQYIKLMVKSEVTTSATEKVASGDSFTCTISLRDDQGFPIVGEEISVGNYGSSAKTDNGGNVEFMLDTLSLWWRNINLSVTFKGSEEYLPSTTFVTVSVQPGFASLLFVLMTSALLILGLTIYREKSRRVFHEGKNDEAELEETYTSPKKVVQTEIQRKHALRIDFPDIRPPFPNVWGIKDTLRIECILDRSPRIRPERNGIELFVNNERVGKDRSYRNRPATFSHAFNEKGEHEVGARLIIKSERKPIKVDAKLRIVDYREEIIRLYKKFLQYLVHQSVDLKASMTAREVETLLLDTVDFDPENLHRVIDCFERAEYSAHEVSRENYETIYLSLRELIIDVD